MPSRIALTGFMGAGKSTVGLRLARELGWRFFDLDEEIVRTQRKSIATIFETSGEASFRKMEHLALAAFLKQSSIVLALGGGAIETVDNRKLLASDPETLLIYLKAPLETLMSRCKQQKEIIPEGPRRPVFERQSELTGRFLHREPFYASAHWTIETAESGPDEIVRTILTRWKQQEAMGRP